MNLLHPIQKTLATALALTLALSSVAYATPAQLAQKQSEASAARAQLDTLSAELETAGEELATVEESLALTNAQIETARIDAEKAEADLATSKAALEKRVSQAYRIGGGSYLEVLLGSSDFGEFVTRLTFFNKLAQNDARLVGAVRDARTEVSTRQATLSQRLAEQQALEQSAKVKAALVQSSLAQQQAIIASLDSEISVLIAQERAREAAEAAAREAAEREQEGNGSGGSGITRVFDPSALGAPHPEAVEEAKKYLGTPYLWGGTTPYVPGNPLTGFDCSGLMQYAYRECGIAIPRNSRTQFSGVHGYIPPDRNDLLQPGDLVFFGTDKDQSKIHHVGMYVGGGSFIHAPQTGDVVRYGTLSARKDYVGATRP